VYRFAKVPKLISAYNNILLKAFGTDVISRLGLHALVFKAGQRLEMPGQPIKHVYFLESGMASMTTVFADGREVEVGMFGYESMIGVSALIGTKTNLYHIYTQIEGTGYRCTLEAAKKEFGNHGIFQKLALRYVQALLVQFMQSAGCAAMHNSEQRLSRWLLISADRSHFESFKMSQEFLSHMLGSTRPTVSLVAGILKKENLITYTRGQVRILDRKGLEKRSCECYRIITSYLADYAAFDSLHMA
jgi:CRP-like cAMP-binding protein